VNFQTLFNCQ